MNDLVNDMVQKDPEKRPNIHECVRRFEDIKRNLSNYKLRSRVAAASDGAIMNIYRDFLHSFQRINMSLGRYPAVPGS